MCLLSCTRHRQLVSSHSMISTYDRSLIAKGAGPQELRELPPLNTPEGKSYFSFEFSRKIAEHLWQKILQHNKSIHLQEYSVWAGGGCFDKSVNKICCVCNNYSINSSSSLVTLIKLQSVCICKWLESRKNFLKN